MSNSTVFFTSLRTRPNLSMPDKLIALIKAAGIETIDFKKKFTAIKIHFGEPGNLAYIRPNYAAKVVSFLKEREAIPYLTDTNTLYHGRRSNAPEHLEAAYENGYNPLVTGCHVIIADGVRGTEYTEIETGQKLAAMAKIGSAIASAEVLISMNHFKGHEMTGFGGALKNLGMGCASVGGKLELHSTSSPKIVEDNCTGCRVCEKNCAHDAIKVNSSRVAVIDGDKCVGCGQCIAVCQFDAAQVVWDSASEIASKMIAEYALAAIKGKPNFHINFMLDISPDCDCWSNNDAPLVPDIGIAASFDPVALDMACADMVKKAAAIPGTRLTLDSEEDYCGSDKFTAVHPNSNWMTGLEYAEKCGLGTRSYTLTEV